MKAKLDDLAMGTVFTWAESPRGHARFEKSNVGNCDKTICHPILGGKVQTARSFNVQVPNDTEVEVSAD